MQRDEIRFADLALISGRQMSIRASTMSIFLVALTKKEARLLGQATKLRDVAKRISFRCCAFPSVRGPSCAASIP